MSLSFLIGLPRSGKSTYTKQWVMEKPGRVVVNGDSIRLALHGQRYSAPAEDMVSAIKYITIRAYVQQGYEVLVDGTHTTDSSIARLLQIDPGAMPIIINTPKEVCIHRAIDTGQEDLIPAIERMAKNFEELLREGVYNRVERLKKL